MAWTEPPGKGSAFVDLAAQLLHKLTVDLDTVYHMILGLYFVQCRSSRRISSRFQRKIWEARQYVGELEFCRLPERAVCEVVQMKS